MHEGHEPRVSFDFHSAEYAARWPELTAEIRAVCPVAWASEYDGFWVVTGYEEASTIARDAERS